MKKTPALPTLSREEIRIKIDGGESFWVQTEVERGFALTHAKSTRQKYTSGKDDRGGFYVIRVVLPTHPSDSKTSRKPVACAAP